LKDVLNKPIRFQSSPNRWVNGRIVDKDGKAKTVRGQNLIDRVSAKLGSDLQELLHHLAHRSGESRRQIEAIRHIRQAAGWLFGGAPPGLLDYLKGELEASGKEVNKMLLKRLAVASLKSRISRFSTRRYSSGFRIHQ
jgi:hypothetical protein